jgi:hypothetical protein
MIFAKRFCGSRGITFRIMLISAMDEEPIMIFECSQNVNSQRQLNQS